MNARLRFRMYVALLGSVALAAFTPVLAHATIPSGNLLVNPGAEQQTPFGWSTTAGTFQALFYGFGDYPSRAAGDAFVGGCEFFTATGATTTAQQTIDVRGVNEIASGTLPASLSAYLGGYLTQTDDAKVDASFRDTNGTEISSFGLAPVTPVQRQNKTVLLFRSNSRAVPIGTTSIVVVITVTFREGNAADGYVDNVALTLDGSTPAAPATSCRPDLDGDGYASPQDCGESDGGIHPGATDVPDDGVDQDCDGADAVDLDRDRDGYNRPQDCDDGNGAIHPGAADAPEDGVDQDCAGGDAVNLDRDRDGYIRPQDCNDGSAAVHPGVADVPANGIDEDCSGADAPLARITAPVLMRWQVDSSKGTRVLGLSIKGAPQGADVRVTCRGRGCPSKAPTPKLKNGDLAAGAIFKRRWLRPGAVVEIQVSRADMIAEVVRYTVRSGSKNPKRTDLCLAPGTKKPGRC